MVQIKGRTPLRIVGALGLICAVGLGLPPSAALAQPPTACPDGARVTPGIGIGPLRIGMMVSESARFLGSPPLPVRKGTVAGSMWEQWYFYPSTDVGLYARDSVVVRVELGAGTPDTRRCATPEGIRLASPAAAVRASYGPPGGTFVLRNADGSQIFAVWIYNALGLQVVLDSGDQVLGMSVFASGTFCEQQAQLIALKWEAQDCAAFTPPLSSAGARQAAPTQPATQAPSSLGTRTIALVSNRDGSDQIYVLTAAGARRLTSPPGVSWSPAFSPDGQKIVFNTRRDGDWQIFLADADGSHATQLTTPPGSNFAPRFSPDGQKIAFTSSRQGVFQIFIMNADGSNVTQLTFPPGPTLGASFSPDGQRVVYQSNRDGAFQVYVMSADGSDSRRLTSPPGASESATYSPDGRKIVFDSTRDGQGQIYIMDVDGSNVTRLTTPPGESLYPSFSPDGTKIIFSSTRGGSEQVYTIDPDGSNMAPLTTGPGQNFFPVFAP